MIAAIDWTSIGTGAALFAFAFWQEWIRRIAKRSKDLAEINASELKVVKHLVNSGMEEQLRINVVSARALYMAQPTSDTLELQQTAERKFKEHMKKQTAVDNGGI